MGTEISLGDEVVESRSVESKIPFQTYFIGGFECSSHYLKSGRRLDLIATTKHDQFCRQDYQRLVTAGIRTAREGIRWHLIEKEANRYDFSTVVPFIQAARECGIQIIWDIFHYGWPDHLEIFSPEFVTRFRNYARAFAEFLASETDETPCLTPVNEISFLSWGGGDSLKLNPYARNRGYELKKQLIRCYIEGAEAFWEVHPETKLFPVDPIIHIATHPKYPSDKPHVEAYNNAQFQSWDMLSGRLEPELGGADKYLGTIGVNYYWNNQWIHRGGPISRFHSLYRPFRDMLKEYWERYQRPMFIGETGIEDEARPNWLRYLCREVRAAQSNGVPIEGICLYPIVNHPGWVNNRHCHNGLWDYPDADGNRKIYAPLANELRMQIKCFEKLRNRQQNQAIIEPLNSDPYASSTLLTTT